MGFPQRRPLCATSLVSISPAHVSHAAHLPQGSIFGLPPQIPQPLRPKISTLTSARWHDRGYVGLIENKQMHSLHLFVRLLQISELPLLTADG